MARFSPASNHYFPWNTAPEIDASDWSSPSPWTPIDLSRQSESVLEFPYSPLFYVPEPSRMLCYRAPSDPELHKKIVNQIEYYFSKENLIKDLYLRRHMDEQGWVPIQLIAGFKMVSKLTRNIQIILDALRISRVVELKGEKLRLRNEWVRWILPPSMHCLSSQHQIMIDFYRF